MRMQTLHHGQMGLSEVFELAALPLRARLEPAQRPHGLVAVAAGVVHEDDDALAALGCGPDDRLAPMPRYTAS
ncbi:hypothetical protein AB0M25_15920 [Streptomyces griseomycini]|uniref:hypothetical protein n=1 Tax=Streptomyces griseomycini TaxID=66895 RepID=UPI0034293816